MAQLHERCDDDDDGDDDDSFVDSDSRLVRCDDVWWLEQFMRFCVSSGSGNGTRNSDCLALKMKAPWSFEMPGTSH